MTNPYDAFSAVSANYVPLSPLSFLPRAASIYLMVGRLFMANADIHGAKLLPDAVVWPQGYMR